MVPKPSVPVPGLSFQNPDGVCGALGAGGVALTAEEKVLLDSSLVWLVEADRQLVGEAAPAQLSVRCCGETDGRFVVCLPGVGTDRSSATYAKLWAPLTQAGFSVLALDMPGYGRAPGKPLPSRTGYDGALLLGVLKAFGAAEVFVVADGGGAGPFLRAAADMPELFGGHHVLINPVVAEVPPEFVHFMQKYGGDVKALFSDGLGSHDSPFSMATCAQFMYFCETNPERAEFVMLLPPRGPNSIRTAMVKPMRPEKWLYTTTVADEGKKECKGGSYQMINFSPECASELCEYFTSPRKEPVREDGGPQAPTQSALMQGKENDSFRVLVRVRPFLDREKGSKGCAAVTDVQGFPRDPPPQRIVLTDPRNRRGGGEFVFDRVFHPGTQQEFCESAAQRCVESVVGMRSNATILAYGQTGSGKTFTMEGPAGGEGVLQYAVRRIFSNRAQGAKVLFQYVQLYNNDFLDLLDPPSEVGGGKRLSLADAANFHYLAGALLVPAQSPEEMLQLVAKGAMFRATGATNMNDASSRSHAILIIVVEPPGGGGPVKAGSAMYLVDLAGSERVKRSGVQGARFEEATMINGSLSTLGRVVLSLVERDGRPSSHIPYMDNSLTMLLKSGLGGNSVTVLVACITGADDSVDESTNTLRFAAQASHVKNAVAKKDKADQAAAEAAKITLQAKELSIGPEGWAEVPLDPPLKVWGSWAAGDGPVIICIHDKGKSASQFEKLLPLLGPRVLAPEWNIESEDCKKGTCFKNAELLLKLVDYLGVAKPTLFGIDAGAVIAGQFKRSYKTRVGSLVLLNMRLDHNEKSYKAANKKDPSIATAFMTGPFISYYIGDFSAPAETQHKMCKNLGKTTLMWPLCKGYLPDPQCTFSGNKIMMKMKDAMKATLVDSWQMDPEDMAKAVLKAATLPGGSSVKQLC